MDSILNQPTGESNPGHLDEKRKRYHCAMPPPPPPPIPDLLLVPLKKPFCFQDDLRDTTDDDMQIGLNGNGPTQTQLNGDNGHQLQQQLQQQQQMSTTALTPTATTVAAAPSSVNNSGPSLSHEQVRTGLTFW